MPYQVEMLRIESPELMTAIREAAEKMYKKNRGYFSVDLRIERDVLKTFFVTIKTLYFLKVRFESGAFGSGDARFEFADESKDDLYRVAIETIQAWSKSYFKEDVLKNESS